MEYAITREYPEVDYDDAVAQVVELLKAEGFGVLTEIDVKKTLKQKLDVDFSRYVILGACNPPLAHRALSAEPLIGTLLPCNVVVMENASGGSIVSAFNPSAGFQMIGKPEMQPIADEVEARMKRVVDGVS